MSTVPDRLNDIRFADLSTFLVVRRCASITGAARELQVTPSQVSKAIARLEGQLHITLLSRGARGVAISDHGLRLAPQIEEVVEKLRRLHPNAPETTPELTFAAPSFLNSLFLPVIAAALPRWRVRALELPPALLRAYTAENFFDVTLTVGVGRMPEVWVSTRVGNVRKSLFASPALAARLGKPPVAVERLYDIPFVSPVYHVNGQFVSPDDDCPLHMSERKVGHEVQTLQLALELACRSEQLVFGPFIAARPFLERGALVEIAVKDWNVSEPMFVACNGNRVLAPTQKAVVAALQAELARLNRD